MSDDYLKLSVDLVDRAHRQQLADRLERAALTETAAQDPQGGPGAVIYRQAYALRWIAEYAAERILKDAPASSVGAGPPRPRAGDGAPRHTPLGAGREQCPTCGVVAGHIVGCPVPDVPA